ncbi:hypothetical protein SD457_12810 [Coprobacillaceae bacterium CR2/5/TPMF4]|nr:hypothetical protein SD457_12810 [Coprobacillaceae bacterium CR2/5/TPMF4]
MNSILENGQMENAIAYESTVDFDGETDGCKYTLLGGNTRYLAIKNFMMREKVMDISIYLS